MEQRTESRSVMLAPQRPRVRNLRSRLGIAALVGGTCISAVVFTIAPVEATPVVPAAQNIAPQKNSVRVDDPLAAVAVDALTELRAYVRSGDTVTLASYKATRDGIADEIANRLAIDAGTLRQVWDIADVPHQMALMAAFTQLGVPYHRNQSKPGEGFDCSGLTTYAWGVAGTTLTRQSASQIRAAAARTKETAQAGDLVYYPGHAMLYLGVDYAIVHAPYSGRTVEVDVIGRRRSVRFGNPLG